MAEMGVAAVDGRECVERGDLGSYQALLERLAARPGLDVERSALVDQAMAVWARPGFDTLIAVPHLRFEPFAHQLDAATRVLRRLRGRALLADEVGLGKTIEAGLVLSELRARGLAQRVLVVVPAGLVGQWQEELDRKFGLPSVVARGGRASPAGGEQPVVIASLAAARRDPLRSALTAQAWDLVVVDEAHRVRRAASASGRLVRMLRSRYLLLLTATPVENRLDDVFHLVNLVRPGHLGTAREFRSRHGAAESTAPRDLPSLRRRLAEVMVRHRRSEVALMLPSRLAETLRITPSDTEAELYRLISQRVRVEGRQAAPSRALALRSVQQLAGSSPAAVAPALDKLGWVDLGDRARAIGTPEKVRRLIEVVRRHHERGAKVLVFTAFRRTLEVLATALADAGVPGVAYHGSLRRRDKDAAVAAFAGDVAVMVATEAAGEGRNLQFCHVMVNADVPWNPMQIEQRLGRIHRIGQDHDVVVTNLVGRGTIEERILRVLEAKINLFELVVGELDMILGRVQDDFDLESFVYGAHVASCDDDELDTRLTALGDELARARSEHLVGRARVDDLVEARS
jgi:SNF2 family DNA or RNA helicase